MSETAPSLLFLALAAGLAVGSLIGFFWGARKAVEKERLRVDMIFYATTNVVYGGSIQIVWDCVAGRMTKDEMITRLRHAQERREREREELQRQREGSSDGISGKRRA